MTELFTTTVESVKLYTRKFFYNTVLHLNSKIVIFYGTLLKSPKQEKIVKQQDISMLLLPIEISRNEQIDLVRKFCQQCFVSKGMCADFAIHDKGDGNPHVHILLTTLKFGENGFTQKERTWNDKYCF